MYSLPSCCWGAAQGLGSDRAKILVSNNGGTLRLDEFLDVDLRNARIALPLSLTCGNRCGNDAGLLAPRPVPSLSVRVDECLHRHCCWR